MFGEETKSTRPTHETKDYVIKVDKVIKTKNDNLLMINLDVNGVLINGCFLKEVTVKQDGQKYKAGDKCYIPHRKSETSTTVRCGSRSQMKTLHQSSSRSKNL